MNPAPSEAGPPDVPAWAGAAVSVAVLALGFGVAEGVVRLVDGGAFAQLDLFAARPGGGIGLVEGTRALRRPGGGTYRVTLGPGGVRATGTPAGAGAWIVVGDSQVLGLGVEDDQTLAARSPGVGGPPLVPRAVPGWGVEDALDGLAVDGAAGVVVVVNQANDWDEAGRPMDDRFEVDGGWLLPRGAAPWRAAFFGSPLSHVHLLHLAVVALAPVGVPEAPVWHRDAGATAAATARIGAAIRGFAAGHPGLPVVVAYLPLDVATSVERAVASPFAPLLGGRPTRSLAADLAREVGEAPLVDLTAALRDPAAWLDGDYHLSPAGHEAVARALGPVLRAATSGGSAR